jgi:hypothetical protein
MRRITGILELSIQVVADEVKEGLEIGVASMFGDLFTGTLRLVKKESSSSEDIESSSLSRKWSWNLPKSEP